MKKSKLTKEELAERMKATNKMAMQNILNTVYVKVPTGRKKKQSGDMVNQS